MAQNKIQTAVNAQVPEAKAQQSVMAMMNGLLDGEKMRKRFDELLGKRSAQFISSLVNMVNDNKDLQEAFYQSPMSVIKSALQAASYDLPVDPTLGYAYIVPFNNTVRDAAGNTYKKKAATFVIGYKGMVQLCLRTGAYQSVPDAVDVREGELVSYNRLTGDAEFKWIEDEDEREKLPVIGYAGYFRLKNGAEKTIYMTVKQIEAHEKKNRKGQYMGKGWKENFDAMAKKTVIRKLCSHYALMSIEYQDNANRDTMNLANALAASDEPVSDVPDEVVEYTDYVVDESTGEATPKTEDSWGEPDDGAQLPWEGFEK
jgi:recombination protein RecT